MKNVESIDAAGLVQPGTVYLVGAGPGDVGLLTLRAVECLRSADFVLYDYLTSTRALDFLPSHAESLCVDSLPGAHPQRWPHIHARLIAEAKSGKVVIHLKGGDPLIFGRGAEEAEALRDAGVPYEIVPGVTAAFAAGACTEVPLTHRQHASAIALVTGHEHPGKAGNKLNWKVLAEFPGTLAIYMGVARLRVIAAELIARGKPADCPAELVHRASTGDQQSVTGTLADIEDRSRQAGVAAPSLLLIGPSVGLRPERSWFESRSLFGMRVLVTRPLAQGAGLVRQLEVRGAVAELLPTVEIVPPEDWTSSDQAIADLESGQFSWIVFTSANGVQSFFDRLRQLNRDARCLGGTRIAAIGPSTAAALAERHLIADLVPTEQFSSEGLLNELIVRCRGTGVLLVGAVEGRDLLRQRLGEVTQLQVASVYRQTDGVSAPADFLDRLRRGEIHAITLTSVNIARSMLAKCDDTILGRIKSGAIQLIVNSPRLAAWLAEKSLPSTQAPGPTNRDLIRCLEKVWEERRTI